MQGKKALYSPHTGIVDFTVVTQSYVSNFQRQGGVVKLGFEVAQFSESSDKPDFPVTVTDKKSVGFSIELSVCLTFATAQASIPVS